ncbi:MAG: hypothetical protein CTY31_12560 [Hyphomicrobium sp.]|nr:MAG: hypothetical protein CTY39_04455 [Hyphomicrobium sp.]PPC98591.1 MAG: hypothetical protein CTY31_12560 [Hyphomicrobium sp.]
MSAALKKLAVAGTPKASPYSHQEPLEFFVRVGDQRAFAPRSELVAGLIGRGDVILLTAGPGGGKSVLACRLAASVAKGENFLGHHVERGRVLYAAAERASSINARLQALDCTRDDAIILTTRPFDLIKSADEIARAATKFGGTDLLVIDTLHASTGSLDENSSRDSAAVRSALRTIRDAHPQVAILLLHHLTKNGAGSARGSSAVVADADCELRITQAKSCHSLSIVKSNFLEVGHFADFKVIAVPDSTRDDGGDVVIAVGCNSGTTINSTQRSKPSKDLSLALDLIERNDGSIGAERLRQLLRSAFADEGRKADTIKKAISRIVEKLQRDPKIQFDDDTISIRGTGTHGDK